MDDLKAQRLTLNKNLNTLREREAKYGANAPLDLLNQLDDHLTAIELVEQALAGQLTEDELAEALAPLNLATSAGPNINMGDVEGSYLAIGNGAKLIVNKALSAAEEAKARHDFEQALLAEAVINLASRLEQIVAKAPAANGRRNPYKSLLDYRLEDAPIFYGRSVAIHQLLNLIERNPLTILHAESGAGKTSLLQAGLASRLLVGGQLPLHIRPWNVNPTLAIKQTILPALTETPGLAQGSLFDFLHKVSQILGRGTHLYIFLDQFEEFFTVHDEATRQQFIADLAECLEDESLPVRWVLALRKEYFGNLATFRPHIRNPFANDYLLQALNQAEATEVIIEPAKQVGVGYEPELIEALLRDLGESPDGASGDLAPPHVQLVCSTLFDKYQELRTRNPDLPPLLTSAMYEEEGGAQGILRGHLNRVLQRTLTEKERELARRLLLLLVSSDQRRIRRRYDELAAALALYLAGAQSLDDVLEQLIEHRLLKVEEDEATNAATYELAHDYLLTEIKVDPEVQAQKAAEELLAREIESYKRFGALLSPDKYHIIHSQRAHLVLDEEATELLRLSRAALQRITRLIAASAVVIIVLLSLLTWRAVGSRNEAQQARDIAIARQLAAEALNLVDSDTEASLDLALQAVDQADLLEVKDTLRDILPNLRAWRSLNTGSDDAIAAAWTGDGKRVALGLGNGDVQIWDAPAGKPLTTLSGHTEPVYSVQFNPRDTHLVSASYSDEADGTLRLWDVATGQTVGELKGHTAGVFSLAWQPHDALLLSGSADGTVRLWNMTTLKSVGVLRQHSDWVRGVTWRPDGRKFATVGNNGEVFLWDLDTLAIETRFMGHQGDVISVAWSPDRRYLATGGADGTVRLWDTVEEHIVDVLSGHAGWVRGVAWHPDGRRLASGSGDTRVILWDIETNRPILSLTGHSNWVRSVAWHPSGEALVSASRDGTARIWDINDSPGLIALAGHVGQTKRVAWHPAGDLLASTGDDGAVRLWQPDTRQTIGLLRGHEAVIQSVTWSPDGAALATASRDQTVRLWSAVTMENTAVLSGHTAIVNHTAWSPDGRTLASGSDDHTIILWDPETGHQKQTLTGHTAGVYGLAIGSDGAQLISGSVDKTIIVWDLAAGQPLTTLAGHTDIIWDLALSPDGRYLASASQDTTVRVWDMARGQTIAILPHELPVNGVAWAGDGSRLATASDDGRVRIWEAAQGNIIATLSGHQGSVWSVVWRPPDNAQLATAATDGVVRIFYTDFQDILARARQYQRQTDSQHAVPLDEGARSALR